MSFLWAFTFDRHIQNFTLLQALTEGLGEKGSQQYCFQGAVACLWAAGLRSPRPPCPLLTWVAGQAPRLSLPASLLLGGWMTSQLYSSGEAEIFHGTQKSPNSLAYNEQLSVASSCYMSSVGLPRVLLHHEAGGEAAVWNTDSYHGGWKESLMGSYTSN